MLSPALVQTLWKPSLPAEDPTQGSPPISIAFKMLWRTTALQGETEAQEGMCVFFFFFYLCQLPLLLYLQHWFNKLSFSSGAITRISLGTCFSTWVFCGGWSKRRKIIHSAGDIQHPALLAQALPGDPWSYLMLHFTFSLPSLLLESHSISLPMLWKQDILPCRAAPKVAAPLES